MIITISGTAGSGKSTAAKMVAAHLNAEYVSVGNMRREIARKRGMSLLELNEYAKTHPETDVEVDKEVSSMVREFSNGGKHVVVEGRMQFYFLPESLKIFIKVSPEEGARRIWNDLQNKATREARNEGSISSQEQMEKEIVTRDKQDSLRYLKYYGVDHRDEKQYDLVIDSTSLTPDEVVEEILDFIDH